MKSPAQITFMNQFTILENEHYFIITQRVKLEIFKDKVAHN